MSSPTPTENQKRLVALAYTRSCLRLDAQQEIANASDQRSLVFATLAMASAALVFDALNTESGHIYAIGSASFLSLSAVASAISALPQKHFSTGSHAGDLETSVRSDINEFNVLRGLCENNDADIENNERSARSRAHLYKFGIFCFIIGILTALIGYNLSELSAVGSGELS